MSERRFRRWLLAGFVCLAMTFTIAPLGQAKEGDAIIQGRVLNATNGEYLKNALIAVEGSTRTVLTNDYGEYQITGVLAGVVKLRVSYTGLPAQQLTVTARPGQTVQQDVEFTAAAGRQGGETVVMDAFTVAARKETDGRTIAINEQRYAPDIKNVVSSDEYGDVTEGNVGEFMKYIPGVLVDYNAAAARTISVRGLPPSTTPVSVDGNRMATAASSSPSRTFEFEQVSINNTSRIEVSKSATPDRPADTLGGSVNMVSKSAFERAKALFSYRAYLSLNDTATSLGKTPFGPDGSSERLVKPGFDFTYVKPVSKNFGFVLTGLNSNQFNPQTLSQTNWYPISASLPAGSPASVTADNPYMGLYRLQTSPQTTSRSSIGLTADWRMTPRDVLSLSYQYNYFDSYSYIVNYTFDVGIADMFGPTFTNGRAGQGTANTATNWRHKTGTTWQPNVSYRHNGEIWTVDAGGYFSHASNHYRDIKDGFFNSVIAGVSGATVSFGDITTDRPGTITVISGSNNLPPFDPSGLRLIATNTTINASGVRGSAYASQRESSDAIRGAHANFKREFNFHLPVTLKFGADYRQNIRDIRADSPVWDYIGPDAVRNSADDVAAAFINSSFSTTPPPYGFSAIKWLDAAKMWQVYKAHPEYFTELKSGTTGTIANAVNGSQYISEAVASGYVRTDLRLFKDRLWLVGGVRFERTTDKGQGPLRDLNAIYQQDARGKLVLGANGRPILITSDVTQQAQLQYKDRGSRVARSYDGYYPSANASFNLTDNLVARASYARTVGRPEFSNIIPGTSVADPTATSLLITVNNTGLKPWQANNYDLSLEYYFQQAGVVSFGVFRKDFTDFFGSIMTPATPALLTEFGLDPDAYQGYSIVTKSNVGDASVSGVEFNYSQQLTFLPHWARGVSVFGNGTALHLEGSTVADFNAFVPKNCNWGVSLNRSRYSLMLKWVYRADQRLLARTTAAAPPGDYQWLKGNLKLDVNAEYRLRKGLSCFVNARNITNEPYVLGYYAPTTPGYARQYNTQSFGVQYAVGLKGSF